MNAKTSTWFYGVLSIQKAEPPPHSPNQRSFSALNVRHSLSLLTTTQYGHYIVKMSKRCDLSTCSGNCVFAVTKKVFIFSYSTKDVRQFFLTPETAGFWRLQQTRLAIEEGRNT